MNRAQARQLRFYAYFRHRDMSVAALFRFNWRVYAVILGAAGLSIGAMIYLREQLLAEMLGVAYGLLVLRDASYFLRTKRTWPLLRDLLDWSKVDGRMGSSHASSASPRSKPKGEEP